jgi:hypothetical protein
MNDIEQELNKKLAGWAGFTSNTPDDDWAVWILWGNPNFKTLIRKRVAQGRLNVGLCFTQSLNACFKWLVPKAIEKVMAEQECSSDVAYTILFKKWLQELELIIPNAALALCLAIMKL